MSSCYTSDAYSLFAMTTNALFTSCAGSLLEHASSDLKADKGPGLGLLFNLRFEICAVRGLWFVTLRFVVFRFVVLRALKMPVTSGLVDFSMQSGLLLLALRTSAKGSTRKPKPTTTNQTSNAAHQTLNTALSAFHCAHAGLKTDNDVRFALFAHCV